ncbi:MAG TPA: hypothetical protein VME68_09180 [Acidobacteriaceae bacterium]|nr:hypothetical protein [Acidobacteriaceae bacterium]
MQPAHYRFGGGSTGTFINPLVAVALVIAVLLILFLPRNKVIVPVLLAIFLIPKGQELLLAGAHFNGYRIVVVAGLARWFMMRRTSPLPGGFTSIDRLVTVLSISVCVVFSLRWMEAQAVIKALGDLLDALGGYFVFRFLIRDRQDMTLAIQVMAILAIVIGAEMINEQRTRQNLFGELGGTLPIPEVRDGKVRSLGPFRHAICAGAYGATLVPMLVWLWSERKSRWMIPPAVAGAGAMALTSHSSSNLGALAAGVFALCLWPFRKRMRFFRYGIVAILVALEIVMKGPVWSILEHINLTGASESFHRYQLIDTFIRHFGDWWLVGTGDNGSWGWEMADTSNQYVTYGISGGLLAFSLFIALIARCFGRLGATRARVQGIFREEWVRWCLGSALFAYVIVYFGIDLFDQLEFAWLALVAMIAMTVSGRVPSRAMKPKRPNVAELRETVCQ